MKITKEYLRKVIKEEVRRLIEMSLNDIHSTAVFKQLVALINPLMDGRLYHGASVEVEESVLGIPEDDGKAVVIKLEFLRTGPWKGE